MYYHSLQDELRTRPSQHHSGSGLGLSIVQAIANAHKGTVNITNKDEYCFEVTVGLLIAK